jgi:hypothetical protein
MNKLTDYRIQYDGRFWYYVQERHRWTERRGWLKKRDVEVASDWKTCSRREIDGYSFPAETSSPRKAEEWMRELINARKPKPPLPKPEPRVVVEVTAEDLLLQDMVS